MESSAGDSSSSSTTPRSIYEQTGDSSAALKGLQQRQGNNNNNNRDTSTNPYNEFLCQSMVGKRPLSSKWLKQLQNKEEETDVLVIEQKIPQSESLTVLCRWIKAYNRGLALLMLHKPNDTWELVWAIFDPEVIQNKSNLIKLPPSSTTDGNQESSSTHSPRRTPEDDEMVHVSCQMAFLLLQALLTPNFDSSKCPTFEQDCKAILTWLESAIEDQQPRNKFLLSLIQSNLELSSNHKLTGTVNDSNVRAARKELKQAMEIFQHKLKTAATTTQDNCHETSALNLKANTERLKGNVKKSLVLLGETKVDDDDEALSQEPTPESLEDPLEIMQQMEHYNNLAMVYHSNGKPNLALHSWSKALSIATSEKQASAILQSNGTPQANHQIFILYNAALGCLQHGKYSAAYQCMSVVVKHWVQRADCWLRLAEACIGWHSELKTVDSINFQTVLDSNGKVDGFLLQNLSLPDLNPANLAEVIGSPEDLEQLEMNPLPRASFCLRKCLSLLEGKQNKSEREQLVSLSAHLSFSYICLKQRDYPKTLQHAGFVLQSASSLIVACTQRVAAINKGDDDGSSSHVALKAVVQRQVATGRMYAAEASCAMGDAAASMNILVHGGSDAIDRLASDLAGVTLEEAAKNPSGKARLAKAQAMVRCNASAVTAHLNHLGPAKQLAMSAQAMENAYHQNASKNSNETSSTLGEQQHAALSRLQSQSSGPMYAKRVLAYCMLREGNTSAALQLLRSAPH